MQKLLETAPSAAVSQHLISLGALTLPAKRDSVDLQHAPARSFSPDKPLEVVVVAPQNESRSLTIRLYYRHVNQAERYEVAEMQAGRNRFTAVIPANYTDSHYPLQYYFELRHESGSRQLFPGLGSKLHNQPYFVVRPASVIRTNA